MNMSKKTEEGGYDSAENNGWPDETPQGEGTAVTESTAENNGLPPPQGEEPTFHAIEDHAKVRRIPAPIFAAVRQMKGWSEGKKVTDAQFVEAVNAFLDAPLGGKK
jgi:hypothetical protein